MTAFRFALSARQPPRSRYGEVIGPMASSAHRNRVEGCIAEGGRLTTGGGRPRDTGWFVAPTVFADVDNNATTSREEIFGPVRPVIRYGDEDNAVRIANDSEFGLGGTVWTPDVDRGTAVARRVQTGSIGVHTYLPDPVAPFGGCRPAASAASSAPRGWPTTSSASRSTSPGSHHRGERGDPALAASVQRGGWAAMKSVTALLNSAGCSRNGQCEAASITTSLLSAMFSAR